MKPSEITAKRKELEDKIKKYYNEYKSIIDNKSFKLIDKRNGLTIPTEIFMDLMEYFTLIRNLNEFNLGVEMARKEFMRKVLEIIPIEEVEMIDLIKQSLANGKEVKNG